MGAGANKDHVVTIDLIHQEEITADMTFPMVGPIPFNTLLK